MTDIAGGWEGCLSIPGFQGYIPALAADSLSR